MDFHCCLRAGAEQHRGDASDPQTEVMEGGGGSCRVLGLGGEAVLFGLFCIFFLCACTAVAVQRPPKEKCSQAGGSQEVTNLFSMMFFSPRLGLFLVLPTAPAFGLQRCFFKCCSQTFCWQSSSPLVGRCRQTAKTTPHPLSRAIGGASTLLLP